MTKETVDKAAELFTEGRSAREIGDILGYSETAIAYNLKARFRKDLVSSRRDIAAMWKKEHKKLETLTEALGINPIVIQTDKGTEYAIRTTGGTYSITYEQYMALTA